MRRILTNKGLLEFSTAAELNQGKSHIFTGKSSDLIMVSQKKNAGYDLEQILSIGKETLF